MSSLKKMNTTCIRNLSHQGILTPEFQVKPFILHLSQVIKDPGYELLQLLSSILAATTGYLNYERS